MTLSRLSALLVSLTLSSKALADEGMWTFNNFPAAEVKKRYGFEPTPAWLDALRLASVRIAGGCSASLVAPTGLVMTNHHCARSCIQQLSGLKKKDFNKEGFLARSAAEELRCPAMEVNQLVKIQDVTREVQEATRGVPEAGFSDAQKGAIARLEKACATSDELRCDVVTLYRGGRYELYQYRRFQDVRLVMAPEDAIAFFGGDPDNFMFPRFDLDVTFLRLYGTDGKPLSLEPALKFSSAPLKEGELTFVSGNPGGTNRFLTVAQFEDERDFQLPLRLFRLSELRGVLSEYALRGAEQKRHSSDLLFGVENSLKALKGRHATLGDGAFFAQLKANEAAFVAAVQARPALKKVHGKAWAEVAALVKKAQEQRKVYQALERGVSSDLFGIARALLRYPVELARENKDRLAEYTDSRLPQLKTALLSNKPIYDELEVVRLAWSLTKVREDLGPFHPVVVKLLGSKSPLEVAQAAVAGSKLKELTFNDKGEPTGGTRLALFQGGLAAVEVSKDPMLELARAVDAEARAARKRFETEVEGPLKKQLELLARARFEVFGTSQYPDATFTLRLSYGQVKGYQEAGQTVVPFTTLRGAFERHTGSEPFALPRSWLEAKGKLNLDTQFNLATTNDIIGGNSGSPLVNQKLEVVGLVFDGNIQSLGGDYGFDPQVNRAVSVSAQAILEALEKIYGAQRVVDELTGKKPQP